MESFVDCGERREGCGGGENKGVGSFLDAGDV